MVLDNHSGHVTYLIFEAPLFAKKKAILVRKSSIFEAPLFAKKTSMLVRKSSIHLIDVKLHNGKHEVLHLTDVLSKYLAFFTTRHDMDIVVLKWNLYGFR